ncbi:hypothetical protein C5Y96_04350 [Blastopirellula marina]|uniref:Uncharacterized protein n=1 Tax=Blastopirellula marina TaxID=124 RepID=A0A2S8G3S4_9BACT|nr:MULTISPECIES: hypothetical protein [Pirellulaceae]PQO39098.1 hypothetical protein C5Y96_04350 [Blastopirellula marina]RCS55406.1 hypothetical protein DTL36_04360 [Bremerella cremea]
MIRSTQQNEHPADDDRFLEAMRYLLDEMSGEEAERFEADLATDQSLRELLAEAVLLTQASYQAYVPQTVSQEPVEVASPGNVAPGNGFRLRVLLSLAACLIVFVLSGLVFVSNAYRTSYPAAANVDREGIQLAAAWVENIEDDTDVLAEPWADLPEEEDNFFEQLLVSTPENPPSWMLKALAAQQETESETPAL